MSVVVMSLMVPRRRRCDQRTLVPRTDRTTLTRCGVGILDAMDRDELGSCLRTWRDRLAPSEVGLPTQALRRAPGLRREEVAQLAGLSADYLTRLEQGRAVHPSAQVLE